MVNHSGGKANQEGIRYQTQVETYFSAMLLAEKALTPMFDDIPSNACINMLHLEQGKKYDVDDVIVEYNSGHKLFIQVTTSLHLSQSKRSKFAHIISQFVKQYNSDLFDKDKCFLVIVTTSSSSKKITEVLNDIYKIINATERFDQCISRLSIDQQEVLNVIKKHIENIHIKEKRTNEEINILNIIKTIRVMTLDFKNSANNYKDTLELLRQQIIFEPEQDRNAYVTLFDKCSDTASKTGSIARDDLVKLLNGNNIYLNATFSYRNDIKKLIDHTKRNIETLSKKAFFTYKDKQIKIPRECVESLLRSVKTGSILIIGDPGVGKSGVIHELIQNLQNFNATLLLLLCDTDDISTAGILKNEPSLKNNILDICSNWGDDSEKYFIIDGFDSLRNYEKDIYVISLINNILGNGNNWKVILSIRSYDLRFNIKLQEIFKGQIAESKYTNPDFDNIRHFQIPYLCDQEIMSLQKENQEFIDIINTRNNELKAILLNVFYLSLYCGLDSLNETDINEIRSELELLNKYWKQEILYNGKYSSDRLTAILNEITSIMVDKFSLKVERKDIKDIEKYDKESDYLFKANILVDLDNKERIAFSHNIIFDFAVHKQYLQRLTLRDFINNITDKSDLLLFIFPSFQYFYLEKWYKDKKNFYEYAFKTLKDSTPILSHIIQPIIMIEVISNPDDVNIIFENLKNDDTRIIALKFFKYLNAALKYTFKKKIINDSNEIEIWYDIAYKFNNEINNDSVFHVQNLLDFLLFHPKHIHENELVKCGILARKCLNHYLNNDSMSYLVIFGVKSVVKTLNSDTKSSYILLKEIFTLSRLKTYGSKEIRFLVNEINENFLLFNSNFIKDIFDSAFEYFDNNLTKVPFWESQILPIISTRNQEWGTLQYSLAHDIFLKYLNSYPELATASLIKIINLISNDNQYENHPRNISKPYTFLGIIGEIKQDFPDNYKLDQRFQFNVIEIMLNTFTQFLLENLKAGNYEEVKILLKLIVNSTDSSILWSKIIKKGVVNLQYFANLLYELILSVSFLTHFDIGEDLRKSFSLIYQNLDSENRENIRQYLITLDTREEEAFIDKEYLKSLSKELTSILDKIDNRLKLNNTDFLKDENDYKGDSSYIIQSDGRHIRTSHLEHLSIRGLKDIQESEKEINLKLETIFHSPLNLNYYKNINKSDLDKRIIILQDFFNQSQQASIQEILSNYIKENIIDDFSRIIEDCYNLLNDDQIDSLKNYFKTTINEYFNKKSEVIENSYQLNPAKFSIAGLIKLISNRGLLLSDEEKVLWKIINSNEVALIESLAFNLYRLQNVDNSLVIDFLKILLTPKNSLQIIMSALKGINNFEILKAIETNLFNLVQNLTRSKDSELIIDYILHLIGELYFVCNSSESKIYINEILESFELNLDEILALTQVIRSHLTSSENIRITMFYFQEKVLGKIIELQSKLQEKNFGMTHSQMSENDQTIIKKMQDILNKIIFGLYDASGAASYNLNKTPNSSNIHEIPSIEVQQRFVIESENNFKKFKSLLIHPSILHDLFKTYEFLQRHNPKFFFELCYDQLLNSKNTAYIIEPLGRDVIVNILNNTATQFRSEVLTDSSMRKKYVEIVGLLIECDWPQAYELYYNFKAMFKYINLSFIL